VKSRIGSIPPNSNIKSLKTFPTERKDIKKQVKEKLAKKQRKNKK